MSSDSTSFSRRQFLAGCGAAGAAAVGAPLASAAQQEPERPELSPPTPALAAGGQVSLEGQQALAAVDRRFQQQRPRMQRTVSAVDDLGLDPSGETPINGNFGSALSGMSNTRITFPSDGTFALSGHVTAIPEGPVELIGNGCSFVIPAGTEMKSLTLVLPGGSLVHDITIDQSAKGALQELSIQSDGVVRADNVTIKGYAPAKPSDSDQGGVDAMFSPIARTSEAVIRATNFTAVGGTAAGTHNEGDLPPDSPENTLGSPMGIWVGQANEGTIQLSNPKLRGWSNGIYGGRTPGIVEMYAGLLVNNFNSQARLGGGSVIDGVSMLLDDRQWSDKGPFKIGHQGVYAVRVDAKKGNQTDPITFKNCKVVAKSMREGAALFDWESESGPGIIRNCHITNHLDRPVVLGESPSAPAATNILVDQSLIDGSSSAAVMEIQGRPQSKIQQTCIKLPNAGPDDIQGATVGSGVSFGKQCKSGSGLSNPKKVGSGGNISSLPAPTGNSSGSVTSGATQTPPRARARGAGSGNFFAALFGGFFGGIGLLLMMMVLVPVGFIALLWQLLSS
ncbi:twin-arginine translocation signal domain-containing protein [Halococcus sp. AFM35]|uniref:twin-arginine translocation signal domain-containing protein n=1 Tax=Halococcus sp. AFM35 TaxID=3421653 RepID=UPI003EB77EB4